MSQVCLSSDTSLMKRNKSLLSELIRLEKQTPSVCTEKDILKANGVEGAPSVRLQVTSQSPTKHIRRSSFTIEDMLSTLYEEKKENSLALKCMLADDLHTEMPEIGRLTELSSFCGDGSNEFIVTDDSSSCLLHIRVASTDSRIFLLALMICRLCMTSF